MRKSVKFCEQDKSRIRCEPTFTKTRIVGGPSDAEEPQFDAALLAHRTQIDDRSPFLALNRYGEGDLLAVEHYRLKFRFEPLHVDRSFAAIAREQARIHLWHAGDRSWKDREDLKDGPVASGAESFLAGTASCRIEVEEVEVLYRELALSDVLHPASRAGVTDTDFGTREFACLDLDGNLIEFFRWTTP